MWKRKRWWNWSSWKFFWQTKTNKFQETEINQSSWPTNIETFHEAKRKKITSLLDDNGRIAYEDLDEYNHYFFENFESFFRARGLAEEVIEQISNLKKIPLYWIWRGTRNFWASTTLWNVTEVWHHNFW